MGEFLQRGSSIKRQKPIEMGLKVHFNWLSFCLLKPIYQIWFNPSLRGLWMNEIHTHEPETFNLLFTI
ncbi:hypothetical protein GTID1_11495 [Geobacillus thermodenitrificans]|nr:hypothetical protein GTID1_11495 [Geobacillus thermodenitrificans]